MNYAKPEVILFKSAAQAVQNADANKSDPAVQDSELTRGTSAAYQADE
jgi:hypothetical protein